MSVRLGVTAQLLLRQIVRWNPTRGLASSPSTSTGQPTISQRRAFKDLPVDPAILSYIKSIGVGIPPRGRKRIQSRHNNKPSAIASVARPTEIPLPFGPSALPVRIISSVEAIDTASENMGFPPIRKERPEVALIGRSNVGKSTLLNALLYANRTATIARNQKPERSGGRSSRHQKRNFNLPKGVKASTSNRPGETTKITFYKLSAGPDRISSSRLCLVDLPGYGFAYSKSTPESSSPISDLMLGFFQHRQTSLKRILLLLDARHGFKRADVEFLQHLETTLVYNNNSNANANKSTGKQPPRKLPPIQLVLTKCDLVDQSDLARRVQLVKQQLSETLRRESSKLPVMLVSARSVASSDQLAAGAGLLELQKELAALKSTDNIGMLR